MNDSDRKLLQGCVAVCFTFIQFAMTGVIFIYAITHW